MKIGGMVESEGVGVNDPFTGADLGLDAALVIDGHREGAFHFGELPAFRQNAAERFFAAFAGNAEFDFTAQPHGNAVLDHAVHFDLEKILLGGGFITTAFQPEKAFVVPGGGVDGFAVDGQAEDAEVVGDGNALGCVVPVIGAAEVTGAGIQMNGGFSIVFQHGDGNPVGRDLAGPGFVAAGQCEPSFIKNGYGDLKAASGGVGVEGESRRPETEVPTGVLIGCGGIVILHIPDGPVLPVFEGIGDLPGGIGRGVCAQERSQEGQEQEGHQETVFFHEASSKQEG